MDLVYSAYSHRHCLMCETGIVPCKSCKGSGLQEGKRRCAQCDGFGVVPCGFCHGTGWGDPQAMPAEIRPFVLQRQLKHLRQDLARLEAEAKACKSNSSAAASDESARRRFCTWLLRIQSRFADLEQAEAMSQADDAPDLQALKQRVDQLLDSVRAPL